VCSSTRQISVVIDAGAGLLSRSSLEVKKWNLIEGQNGRLLESLGFRFMIAKQVLFLTFTSRNME